jgi:hypothetical protein
MATVGLVEEWLKRPDKFITQKPFYKLAAYGKTKH